MDTSHTVTVRREPGPLTRSLVALTLRVGLGLAFLMFGLQKFDAQQEGEYPGMITNQFEDTVLGEQMPGGVKLFADVLPYAEAGLGVLLLAGLFTTVSAFLTGVLLLHLLFGLLVLGDPSRIPTHFIYILVNAGILWLSPVTSNYLSFDGLLFGWFWKPRAEGEYRREPEQPARQ